MQKSEGTGALPQGLCIGSITPNFCTHAQIAGVVEFRDFKFQHSKVKNFTNYTRMPAIKRKSTSVSTRPLKRTRAIARTYSGATARKLPLSTDHQLLRTRQNVVLRYHETFTINPGLAGVPGYYVFRSNSCYDPNLTGVGHQPRGYDQIMAMYQYLAVKEAQIEIWFHASDGADTILCISADAQGPTGTANRNEMMEQRTAVYKAGGGVSSTGPSYVTMRVKPWELAGSTLSDSEYKHLENANPTITQFFNVFAAPLDASDAGDVNCVARITYHCVVTEPKNPIAS